MLNKEVRAGRQPQESNLLLSWGFNRQHPLTPSHRENKAMKITTTFLFLLALLSLNLNVQAVETNQKQSGKQYFYQTTKPQTSDTHTHHNETDHEDRADNQTYHWSVIQAENFIQINKQTITEVWLKNGDNQKISLLTVLNGKNIAIEYNSGDFQALDRHPNWQTLQTFLPPSLYDSLIKAENKIATTDYLSHQASIYQRQQGNNVITLTWLDNEQLPAKITIKNNNQLVTETTLTEIKNTSILPVSQWITDNKIEVHDYADVGDKESDQTLQKLINLGAIAPQHNH